MDLKINLSLDNARQKELEKEKRIMEAQRKKALKAYQPTQEEIWYTGYATSTGKHKPGIFQTKLSDSDLRKLEAVKEGIDSGVLSTGVDDMKKFTKTHALKLYQKLVEVKRDGIVKHMIETRPENYVLVSNLLAFGEVLHELSIEEEMNGIIALDTETTGLNVHGAGGEEPDKVVGFVITIPRIDRHYYIPFRHTVDLDLQLPVETVVNGLRTFLESERIRKVLHNAKYDIHVMRNDNIHMGGFYFDTMVAMTLLNENEMSYALKNLANKYGKFFGYEDSSSTYEELFGNGGFQDTPLEIGSIYACKDGHLTWGFYEFIMEQFKRMPELEDYYFRIEQPITLVSVEMEKNGFLIDMHNAELYNETLTKQIKELEGKLVEWFGDINLKSPKQLSEFLYDEKELPDVSGKRSTDAKTLKKLAKRFEGCSILLEYRDLTKLQSTYIDALPRKVDRLKRLHGQFNQAATVTGRFASREPNLQNLPKTARQIIVAGEGKLIIGIDFSQVEPRTLAHMSKDPKFQAPYLTGRDLYSEIASNVFHKPIEECGDGTPERKKSKVILLGVMYGMSANSLADMLGIEKEEAQAFIDNFFESYPGVAKFVKDQGIHANDYGYVRTMNGRKRRFIGHKNVVAGYLNACKYIKRKYGEVPTDIWGSAMTYKDKAMLWKWAKPYGVVQRQSVNAVIQGTAAEIMKIAMIDIWHLCKKKGYRILATVHDEVLIEVPETITREEVEELERTQCNAVTLDIPLKVDVEIMKVWSHDSLSKEEWIEKGCVFA